MPTLAENRAQPRITIGSALNRAVTNSAIVAFGILGLKAQSKSASVFSVVSRAPAYTVRAGCGGCGNVRQRAANHGV